MSKKTIKIDKNLGEAGAGMDDSHKSSKLRETLQDMLDNQNRIAVLQAMSRAQAADGAANSTLAETDVDVVLVAGDLTPYIYAQGALTAHDDNNAVITFRLYRAGSVVNTWTITTDTVAGGGTGNWTNQQLIQPATTFAAVPGDLLTVQEAKNGTGVQQPKRRHGATIV